MSYVVDFVNVSTVCLESSPVADALAGLRANEARYFANKYDHVFTTQAAADVPDLAEYVRRVIADERGLVIASPPLEATEARVDGVRWTYVFYESGLAINVLYTLAEGGKRAVASSSPTAWTCPRSSPTSSSSHGRSRRSPARSAARSSS